MAGPSDRLKQARETAGWSGPREAARNFGWNENTYKSHENGVRGLPWGSCVKYARAFRVNPYWIWTGQDPPPTNLRDDERDLLDKYRKLDKRDQSRARQFLDVLARQPRDEDRAA